MKPLAHLLAPDGAIPNHPRWPLLIYPGAVANPEGNHPATCMPPFARKARNAEKVARVPLPACDPVFGAGGPLFEHWKAA